MQQKSDPVLWSSDGVEKNAGACERVAEGV